MNTTDCYLELVAAKRAHVVALQPPQTNLVAALERITAARAAYQDALSAAGFVPDEYGDEPTELVRAELAVSA
jgi:hypothetical protein